ncbi:MAG: hypothetical protein B7Z66_03315 [Chromatiales bacterium 21-64-14]|nr:MAG: hypothetical protein B7Z66_03315 [Chromatiales bacterium 21-64-14]HQU15832.1 hypothetical protein [Gammaproteobacteria bacterium]
MGMENVRVDRDRAVLLLVEVQPDLMPGGALAATEGDRIVAPISALIGIAPCPYAPQRIGVGFDLPCVAFARATWTGSGPNFPPTFLDDGASAAATGARRGTSAGPASAPAGIANRVPMAHNAGEAGRYATAAAGMP